MIFTISLLTSINTGLLMWMLARGDTRGWYLSLFVAQPLWIALIVVTQAWGLAPLTTWMTYVAIKGVRKHRFDQLLLRHKRIAGEMMAQDMEPPRTMVIPDYEIAWTQDRAGGDES